MAPGELKVSLYHQNGNLRNRVRLEFHRQKSRRGHDQKSKAHFGFRWFYFQHVENDGRLVCRVWHQEKKVTQSGPQQQWVTEKTICFFISANHSCNWSGLCLLLSTHCTILLESRPENYSKTRALSIFSTFAHQYSCTLFIFLIHQSPT